MRRIVKIFLVGALAAAAAIVPAPLHAEAPPPPAAITVLTWNIHYEDPDEIAEAVDAAGASIVALQEVDAHRRRSGCADQAAEIAAALDMTALFGPHLEDATQCGGDEPALHGDAILTSHPVLEWRHVLLPTRNGEQRGFVEAVLDVGGGRRVRIVSTHFEYRSSSERKDQAETLVEHLEGTAEPVVVMGDLNGEPDDPALRPLRQRFVDAWEAAGSGGDGYTSPRRAPRRRIDYVFAGGGFTPVAAEVLDHGPSDHLPVLAELGL